jgi:hypothetical protein
MQALVKFSSECKHSKHFINGLTRIGGILPYNGPLTQWQEETFAQRELCGRARDAYAIKVADCHWFPLPTQVYTRRTRAGETQVQVRASCVAFYPSVSEKLLSNGLGVERHTNQAMPYRRQNAHHNAFPCSAIWSRYIRDPSCSVGSAADPFCAAKAFNIIGAVLSLPAL